MPPVTDLQELIDRGRELAAQQRLDAADVVFSQVLEVDADNLEAMRFKGSRALGAGALDEAESWMRLFIELNAEDDEIWYLLGLTLQQQGRLDDAIAAIERSLSIDGRVVRAWLVHGGIREAQGLTDAAAASYLRALRIAEALGLVATDPSVQRMMDHTSMFVNDHLDRGIRGALARVVAVHGEDAVARIRKAADGLLGKSRFATGHPLVRPGLFFVPDLKPHEFLDPAAFPWVERVEAATGEIRNELEALFDDPRAFAPVVTHAPRGAVGGAWDSIVGSTGWQAFRFYRQGAKVEENCSRCPRTTALVESLDLFRSPASGPEVSFSILHPATRIPPRHGPTNGRVVAYLPLSATGDGNVLRVGNEERRLETGRLTLFDDSFLHEEWNDGDRTRAVLTFEVWDPALSEAEREAFAGVLKVVRELELAAFDTPFSPDRLARG